MPADENRKALTAAWHSWRKCWHSRCARWDEPKSDTAKSERRHQCGRLRKNLAVPSWDGQQQDDLRCLSSLKYVRLALQLCPLSTDLH